MNWTKHFSEISKHDAATAGGKGASLGELTQAGIPVPPGFVVLTNAFQHFIEVSDINIEIDSILKTVDINAMHTVENASAQIQSLILEERAIPEDIKFEIEQSFKTLNTEFVAVRSSATAEDSASAAWAGQLDSFLNTTEKTLLENVRRCWASLFTPRAIFYRFEKGLDQTHISVAVVVQKMVNADAAGIAFSVHPVTEDRNQIIIEAAFGLGEAVVSGQITPDSYVTTKSPRVILDKNIVPQTRGMFRKVGGGNEWRELPEAEGQKQVLSDEQILALSDTVVQIENHYGFPCDIEWSMEGDEIYVVQSRPITTLADNSSASGDGAITVLTKSTTRERSLLYVYIWYTSDLGVYREWTGIELRGSLFIGDGVSGRVSAFYDQSLADQFTERVLEKQKLDHASAEHAFTEFATLSAKLQPFVTGERTIQSVQELNEYYRLWVAWWKPMAVLLELADAPDLAGEFAQRALQCREQTERWAERADEPYLDFVRTLYPELVPYVQVLSPSDWFSGEIIDSTQLAEKARHYSDGYCVIDGALHPRSSLDSLLKEHKYILEVITEKSIQTLVGSVGYRGRVQGIVRVLRSRNEIGTFQSGEVLVTEMTTPEFLVAAQRAVAIVTDEGGITCHAAIVARELKKPCVIGTKFATEVLHDGDLVEVDADNGVVRILGK